MTETQPASIGVANANLVTDFLAVGRGPRHVRRQVGRPAGQ